MGVTLKVYLNLGGKHSPLPILIFLDKIIIPSSHIANWIIMSLMKSGG